MLVLSRKRGQGFWVGDVYVKVAKSSRRVRLGVEAPLDIHVIRSENDDREVPEQGFCVLTRTEDEGINIGDNVHLKVLEGTRVQLALHGPASVSFRRSDIDNAA